MAIAYDLEREQRIVLARLSGESPGDIAKRESISRSRVYQMLEVARQTRRYGIQFSIIETDGLSRQDAAKAVRRLLERHGLA